MKKVSPHSAHGLGCDGCMTDPFGFELRGLNLCDSGDNADRDSEPGDIGDRVCILGVKLFDTTFGSEVEGCTIRWTFRMRGWARCEI